MSRQRSSSQRCAGFLWPAAMERSFQGRRFAPQVAGCPRRRHLSVTPLPPTNKPAAQGKRPAQPTTPQPAKKAKQDTGKAPASAPPKVQQQQQQKQAAGGSGGSGAGAQVGWVLGGGAGHAIFHVFGARPAGAAAPLPQHTLLTPPPRAEGEYLRAIVDFIKAEGKPVPLAVLGTRVKRPEGLKAKAKAFVLAHADRLAFNEQAQTVAVKK